MQQPGYGGTGFLAKEVVQDLLHTPIFEDYHEAADSCVSGIWKSVCVDENEWCAIGPGARRGLNRLKGRPVNYGIADSSREKQEEFLAELRALFEERHDRWPAQLLGVYVERLALHDVQFQLCKFDKYLRFKHHEGRVRLYKSPTKKSPAKEELLALVSDMQRMQA